MDLAFEYYFFGRVLFHSLLVSILVLMDLAFESWCFLELLRTKVVSILVLMDLAFE